MSKTNDDLKKELEHVINKYNCEIESATPDFILAAYLFERVNNEVTE